MLIGQGFGTSRVKRARALSDSDGSKGQKSGKSDAGHGSGVFLRSAVEEKREDGWGGERWNKLRPQVTIPAIKTSGRPESRVGLAVPVKFMFAEKDPN